MEPADGATNFEVTGDAYDRFMGRYSRPLAAEFVDWVGGAADADVLDVGCGPGALTGVLVGRARSVCACDPSPSFVEACASRHPDVDVRAGRMEAIPFDDDVVDMALAQLVLHFVSDPEVAAGELRRVVRPGGTVAASTWDFAEGMQMLQMFWDAAVELDPDAAHEARTLRFGRDGEISDLFARAGLVDIEEATITVSSTYRGFDELWDGFTAGIGPAGAYCVRLPDAQRTRLRSHLFDRAGRPDAEFALDAVARCARGQVPRFDTRSNT